MCKPCTLKCKCKTLCNNPHNNGGTCPKCALPGECETTDDEDGDPGNDGQNDGYGEVVPIVPPSQCDVVETDTDLSDLDEQMTASSD